MDKEQKFIKHKNKFSRSENKQRMMFAAGPLFLIFVFTMLFIVFTPATALLLIIILLAVLFTIFPPSLLYRRMRWNIANVEHVKKFPHKVIKSDQPAFSFKQNINEELVSALFKHGYDIKSLDEFLEVTDTTAFMVVLDDVVVYEKYFNGYNRESVQASYSITKSVLSALIGTAIDRGSIRGVNEPITEYLGELKERDINFTLITIKHLLSMSSGLGYSKVLWGDGARVFFSTDLRRVALKRVKIVAPPGERLFYNNFGTILLGIILERATGQSVSDFLEKKIWQPLGMEYPARWDIDSKRNNFEKVYSGLMFRTADLAKLGRLYLNNGKWQDKQIISESWIKESTRADNPENQGKHCQGSIIKSFLDTIDNGYYKYLWWGIQRDNNNYDFLARGVDAQILYVCPQKKLIIVRNGMDYGVYTDVWIKMFYNFASNINKE